MIDMVHDVQRAYRSLVLLMAHPGQVRFLGDRDLARRDHGLDSDISTSELLLGAMVLDTLSSVSFHFTNGSKGRLLSQLTGVVEKPASDADFVWLEEAPNQNPLPESILAQMRNGTLVDPQLGATALINLERCFPDPQQSRAGGSLKRLTLSGPGINGSTSLEWPGDLWWLEVRNQLCREFPLGIDMIFLDPEGRCVALPRSTRVRAEEAAGGVK